MPDKNKTRIEVSIDVFNKLLQRINIEQRIKSITGEDFIEIWADGTVYKISDDYNSDLISDKFFEGKEEWVELQEEIEEIKNRRRDKNE